ncbi:universal stress protein [Streptomyces luteogriseus]|uniref:universal stress protein n=1 Tax=Streptomyces luteogriseus TaxID=68233 RepID=UPI0016071F7F
MDQPITVHADGCEASPRAVDRAAEEAALRGVPPHAVYASPEGALRTRRVPHRQGAAVGTTSHRRPRGHRGPARPGARSRSGGHHRGRARGAGPVLCGAARKAAVLVLGSRGRGSAAEPPLGSVGLAVTRAGGRSGDRGARRPRRSVRAPDMEPPRRRGPRRTGGLGGAAGRRPGGDRVAVVPEGDTP